MTIAAIAIAFWWRRRKISGREAAEPAIAPPITHGSLAARDDDAMTGARVGDGNSSQVRTEPDDIEPPPSPPNRKPAPLPTPAMAGTQSATDTSLHPQIFLSYAEEDMASARALAGLLENQGWSVFWDTHIVPGETWERVIEQRLDNARCVVVLWSAASVESEWVRAEAAAAATRGILVPASLDGTTPPLRFRTIQTADLNDWTGDAGHPGFSRLIAGVRARVANRAH